jgi:hypothetical protein
MTVELASGEQRQLDIQLAPAISPGGLSVYDVFIRTNYDPPSAADNYIHARIRNDALVALTGQISCHYWEAWMEPNQVPDRTQEITVNPGQTIEYTEHFHGNQYWEYPMAMWLTGDWAEEPLTRRIPFQAGYHLRPSQGDPEVEGYVVQAGSDYVVLRYAEFGTDTRWYCRVYTPPIPPYLQQTGRLRWDTPWAYCSFWLIEGLLPGRAYEAHLEGNRREAYIQFNT